MPPYVRVCNVSLNSNLPAAEPCFLWIVSGTGDGRCVPTDLFHSAVVLNLGTYLRPLYADKHFKNTLYCVYETCRDAVGL